MNSVLREALEAEMALRFLARANPPPTLFRYRRPSDWTIDEISKQQLYAATSQELNDPFECRAPIIWNIELMKEQFIRNAPVFGISPAKTAEEFDSSHDWGMKRLLEKWEATKAQARIVCFTAKPNSIRMWSYYAQAHEGVCVSYDTARRPFWVAQKVKYQDPDTRFDVIAASESDPNLVLAAAEQHREQTMRPAEIRRRREDRRRAPRSPPRPAGSRASASHGGNEHGLAVGEQPGDHVMAHARPVAHRPGVEMDPGRAAGRIEADAARLQAHRDVADLRGRHVDNWASIALPSMCWKCSKNT